MAGDEPRRSPFNVSRPATMLVVDCDSGLHELLKKTIQEFELSLTLCQASTKDLKLGVFPSSPDLLLVNLAVSKVCFHLLPEMQQMWPNAKVIFVSELDDVHLYADAIQLGAYDFLPKPLETVELGTILQRAVQTDRTKPRAVAAGT
jgi:DNA-binding NtrC family response regulator